jgi:hypothetical protein
MELLQRICSLMHYDDVFRCTVSPRTWVSFVGSQIVLAMMYEVSWSVLHWNQNSSSTSGFSEAWMSGTAYDCMYIRLHAVTICCIISPGLDTFAKAWMVFQNMCL